MADPSVAVDRLEALQVALELSAKITLDEKPTGSDGVNKSVELLWRNILRLHVRIQLRLLDDLKRGGGTKSVNVGQRGGEPLVAGDFNSK